MKIAARVANFLKDNKGSEYTSYQLAEWFVKNHPADCQAKKENSKNPLETDDELKLQIVRDIGANKKSILQKSPNINITDSRPMKWYFDDGGNYDGHNPSEEELIPGTNKSEHSDNLEKRLYPVLKDFLMDQKVYSKRINEAKSSNKRGKGGNKWLHPDMVGLQIVTEDFHKDVEKIIRAIQAPKVKFWSFEVKPEITVGNLRENFFQAVSNSTWANFGYLVASSLNSDAASELRMLSKLHGIGFILLDKANPIESTIYIPAKERDVDWATVNRLTIENKDFRGYINDITNLQVYGMDHFEAWS